jgi:hypothetical protein
MMFGDYNSKAIEGGSNGVVWFDSNNETEWQIDVTGSSFANKTLFKHSFRQAVLHLGTETTGVTQTDFQSIALTMTQKFAFTCN